MSYQPIENYGLIGNLHTAALVGMDGSIDWMCIPHFDSASVFAAILDDKKGGRFRISATSDNIRQKQHYWPNTNTLITRFLHADGIGPGSQDSIIRPGVRLARPGRLEPADAVSSTTMSPFSS